MGLLIVAREATEVASKVWLVDMPPHQVRMFGEPRQASGQRSVLLLSSGEFDGQSRTLSFDADHATALNLGTHSTALVVGADWEGSVSNAQRSTPLQNYGQGDREFLKLASELPADMEEAARALLDEVRSRWPGDLKRGLQRNFSNTPDNFWYVIVQPRAAELSITVRGEPSHFGSASGLELKVDRPGYSRFKVRGMSDVPAALKIIGASRRKP